MTRRDREILKAVNDCQALQVEQVQTLFFGSPSPTYGRLKKLADAGYLERHYISQVAVAPAASPLVFTLSRLGATVLAASYSYTHEDFQFASAQVLNWKSLQHLLAVNRVRVALTRACQVLPGFGLVEWRSERHFRARPDYISLGARGAASTKKPVLPDGYCLIRTPLGSAHCFVEVDRGTEGLSQFSGQIAIYQAYMTSGGYQARFQTTSLRILVVTTSPRRLENLRRATARAGGQARYWFTTFDRLEPQSILTQAIWQKTKGEGYHPLVAVDVSQR